MNSGFDVEFSICMHGPYFIYFFLLFCLIYLFIWNHTDYAFQQCPAWIWSTSREIRTNVWKDSLFVFSLQPLRLFIFLTHQSFSGLGMFITISNHVWRGPCFMLSWTQQNHCLNTMVQFRGWQPWDPVWYFSFTMLFSFAQMENTSFFFFRVRSRGNGKFETWLCSPDWQIPGEKEQ